MWYEQEENKQIKRDRPIFAKRNDSTLILLPQIRERSYVIYGYNWFNITRGEYNSNVFYETIQDAIDAYESYKISNGSLTVLMEES